jgi:hypothetical protein
MSLKESVEFGELTRRGELLLIIYSIVTIRRRRV